MSLQDTSHFLFVEITMASRTCKFSPRYVLIQNWFILETPSLVWFCRYMLFIKSNVNRIWFYNWWNRDLLAVPETNSGCDIFESSRNYCASQSMSRMCVASVNESPHTRIKRNSQWERANESVWRKFGLCRSTQRMLLQKRQTKAYISKIFLIHTKTREK